MYITRCNYYGIMRSSLGKILQEILTNGNNVSFLSFFIPILKDIDCLVCANMFLKKTEKIRAVEQILPKKGEN